MTLLSTLAMKNKLLLRISLCVATIAACVIPASAEILKVVVDDTIQPISQEYISRAIDEAHRRNDQAVLIEMNTPGGLVEFYTRDHREDHVVAGAGDRLRDSYWRPRRLSRNLHSRIRRHRRHGAGHGGRCCPSSRSDWPGPDQTGRRDEAQDRKRRCSLDALRHQQARTQHRSRRERRARVEVVHRAGGAERASHRLRRVHAPKISSTRCKGKPSSVSTETPIP